MVCFQAAEFNFKSPPNKMTPLSRKKTKEFFTIDVPENEQVPLATVEEGDNDTDMSLASEEQRRRGKRNVLLPSPSTQ